MSAKRAAKSDCAENADSTSQQMLAPSAESSDTAAHGDDLNKKKTLRRFSLNPRTKGFLSSFVFHAALLILLALAVEASRSTGLGPLALHVSQQQPVALDSSQNIRRQLERLSHQLEGETPVVELIRSDRPTNDLQQGATTRNSLTIDMPNLLDQQPTDHNRLLDNNSPRGGGLEGRGTAAKSVLLPRRGGTHGSEEAVRRGLRWLAYHQRDDGSWHFNHHGPRCRGACRNPGTESSTTAATAMALLPFLGAGYTHASEEYGELVGRGLYYLNNRAKFGPHGADLQEGTMYAQGLSAIALCEAYAMSGDENLRGLAQRAIDFIDYAQDKRGGGWRYEPGQPGDTTVTGWQLMALKSGQMARLRVASPTVALAERFLDGVASEYGSRYGYMTPQPRNSTTAIGLLMRMYTGWRRDRPALVRGVSLLDRWGPSKTDMYYNYYATQVLCHYDGLEWKRWNAKLRDHLIDTQAAEGHESGSWYFPDPQGDKGGRLYNTAMSLMILEVYYRYMPLYGQKAIGAEADAVRGEGEGE